MVYTKQQTPNLSGRPRLGDDGRDDDEETMTMMVSQVSAELYVFGKKGGCVVSPNQPIGG
jgi:hypothetical protein